MSGTAWSADAPHGEFRPALKNTTTLPRPYGHDLQSVGVDGFGLGAEEQAETLQRFAEEIAPVVRREAPSTLWD